ncbi:UDP-GlcNAc:betaGal beta-1,3-N-acetylglucosaminyltransferase-like protein 1 [Tupaia chinensis]|uniref:UDP-GlcNAc:betaGal beta-1,3-N-acetylglucosaminyltransferase-like protein 1 n=1 Tax=Tupaia chinensis TaxID=246437 RepID=L9KHF8_TUPCH|nr:UDP-GlcNAc:betaGal beta-1,3-N-acetylglucosaminyltransferase-like protein 1 [Tupaia chinensis]
MLPELLTILAASAAASFQIYIHLRAPDVFTPLNGPPASYLEVMTYSPRGLAPGTWRCTGDGCGSWAERGYPLENTQSVILPVHNAEPWLDQCLQSVLQQDFEGTMELSVFNDASKDRSGAIIEKWKAKLEGSGILVVVGGHNSPSPRGGPSVPLPGRGVRRTAPADTAVIVRLFILALETVGETGCVTRLYPEPAVSLQDGSAMGAEQEGRRDDATEGEAATRGRQGAPEQRKDSALSSRRASSGVSPSWSLQWGAGCGRASTAASSAGTEGFPCSPSASERLSSVSSSETPRPRPPEHSLRVPEWQWEDLGATAHGGGTADCLGRDSRGEQRWPQLLVGGVRNQGGVRACRGVGRSCTRLLRSSLGGPELLSHGSGDRRWPAAPGLELETRLCWPMVHVFWDFISTEPHPRTSTLTLRCCRGQPWHRDMTARPSGPLTACLSGLPVSPLRFSPGTWPCPPAPTVHHVDSCPGCALLLFSLPAAHPGRWQPLPALPHQDQLSQLPRPQELADQGPLHTAELEPGVRSDGS